MDVAPELILNPIERSRAHYVIFFVASASLTLREIEQNVQNLSKKAGVQ